jgi:O-antigen/teichoic acid export membrane protein
VLFAPWILVLLFSSSFLAAGNLVVLFVIAQGLMLMGGNYYALLIGLGDLKGFGVLSVLGHLSVAGFVWLLAPSWGIAGVGIGFILGYAIHYLLTLWRLRVVYHTRIGRRWWLALGYGLLALALGGVVAAVSDPWSPWVILAKLGGCAVFAVSLLALFDRAELHQLVATGQRLLFPGGLDRKARVGGDTYRRLTQRFFPDAW